MQAGQKEIFFSVSMTNLRNTVLTTKVQNILSNLPHSSPERIWLIPIFAHSAAAAKSLQSCPTLCNPLDGSPLGSPIPGILQARTLEWVAITFSNAWKWKVKVKSLSRVRLFTTHGLQPTRLLHPLDFPGKSTGVGSHHLAHSRSP